MILFSDHCFFSFCVIVMDSGRWIDLPHVKNGIKPSDHQLAQINTGSYLEEGPTVKEPLNQVRQLFWPYKPLRWLKTVFSIRQDVDFNGSL